LSSYSEYRSEELPSNWKRVSSDWGHSLHTICPRIASFPPRLVHYFVSGFSRPGDRVLDLYSGKGTTVLEACLLGRKGIGNDIAPDAYLLTLAKSNPPHKDLFLQYLYNIKNRIRDCSPKELDNELISIYYSKNTLRQVLQIKELISQDEATSIERNDNTMISNVTFLKALMLGIMHGTSSYTISLPMSHASAMSPSYVKKKLIQNPSRFRRPDKDLIQCLFQKFSFAFRDPLPRSFLKGEAYNVDATELRLDAPVNLIITSPPYYNVHTYAWDNWIRLWFLGYDFREVRRKLLETESEDKYSNHISKSLSNMYDLLAEDSRCIIVVGNVRNRKSISQIIIDSIKEKDLGFQLNMIIDDDLRPNKKYQYGAPKNHGVSCERILELHKGEPFTDNRDVKWSY